ncbi:MAG: DoxX family protein, partial [Flavobacteriaceae bacterium]|nr:DoxX family protein [Flavobacteriaceae bacterium]
IPEDAPQPVIEYTWTFKENGEDVQYVTNGSYPESSGTYVGVETEIIKEGYEPPIHDFSIEKNGENYTEDILSRPHVLLIINYNLAKAETEGLKTIKVLTDKAIENGYDVIGITATGPEEANAFKKEYNLNFDYYFCDETALKTIVRSNPGILKLEEGTIIQKKHWNDADEIELPKVERPKPEIIEEEISDSLYFINEVPSTKEEVEALDSETIESVNIVKDSLVTDEETGENKILNFVKVTLKQE